MAYRNFGPASRSYTTAQITDIVTRFGPSGTQEANAILPGTQVWDSTAGAMKVYNGTTFIVAAGTGAGDAGTLTGTTLASNVVTSSLTSTGTLATLTVTAPIAGSVTGSAATVTGAAQTAITSVGTLTGLTVGANKIVVTTAQTPASAAATGTAGSIAWDADYIYIATATNTWKKVAIATW